MKTIFEQFEIIPNEKGDGARISYPCENPNHPNCGSSIGEKLGGFVKRKREEGWIIDQLHREFIIFKKTK